MQDDLLGMVLGGPDASVGETPAHIFARFSQAEGLPDPEMVIGLVEAYGEAGASEPLAYLRVLLVVQRMSRSLDALLGRLVGRPRPDSTLRGESSVVVVALLGDWPLVPVMRWRAARRLAAS